jgi:hypothetical protein
MADYNASVALGINSPDPQAGLSTLNKIMELGQRGLAIRGQQSENITKASQATIAQQNAKENQNLAGAMSDPIKAGIVDQDGNPTPDAQRIIMQLAPTTGSQHYENIVSAATKKVAFNSAVNNLRTDERAEVASTVAGAAAGAQQPSDVTDALDNLVASKKGTPEAAHYQTIADTAKQAINHMAKQTQGGNPPPAGQEPWRQGALNIGRSILPAGGTVGAGGIAAPQGAQIDTGAQVVPGTTAPALAGGAFRPSGPPVAKVTPPTVTTNATGQLIRVAPGGAGASVVPTQAPPGAVPGQPTQNANPTIAQAVGQRGQAEAVSQRVAQVQAQAANTVQAQDALNRAREILESPESPATGAGFERVKSFKNALSSLGIDTTGANDMNTLTKNLARYEASRATAAGLGGTDAARELAHSGSPNTQLDNKALQGIVRQSLATEKVLAGYANVQSKTNDPQTQLQNEAAFRAIPHPIETAEFMMSKSPEEAEKYLQEHGLKHADVAKSAAMLKQFGAM